MDTGLQDPCAGLLDDATNQPDGALPAAPPASHHAARGRAHPSDHTLDVADDCVSRARPIRMASR
jgi:hypothetical protein